MGGESFRSNETDKVRNWKYGESGSNYEMLLFGLQHVPMAANALAEKNSQRETTPAGTESE